jgi:nucleoside-diphosphate-sugar epimerase
MIARAFIQQDPFEVWGTGEQIRNWTYVQDIVDGTILAAERIDDASAINLGTTERIRVIDAVKMILPMFNYDPKIVKLTDMPVGPMNRVASNDKAKELLGWQPKFTLSKGLVETVEWYKASRTKEQVIKILSEGGLIKRKVELTAARQ